MPYPSAFFYPRLHFLVGVHTPTCELGYVRVMTFWRQCNAGTAIRPGHFLQDFVRGEVELLEAYRLQVGARNLLEKVAHALLGLVVGTD